MAIGKFRRVSGIILCSVELCLLSGVICGWIHVVQVFQKDHLFTNLCNSANVTDVTNSSVLKGVTATVSPHGSKQSAIRKKRFADGVFPEKRSSSLSFGKVKSEKLNITQTIFLYLVQNTREASSGDQGAIYLSVAHPLTIDDGWYGIFPYKDYRCREEWQTYAYVYIAGMFGAPLLLLVAGILYDFCGTWVVRIISIVCIIGGNLMIAFAANELSPLVYGGVVLVALGGLILLLSNIQLANFFFTTRSIIICTFIGCYFTSSGVYLAIRYIYEAEFPRRYLFFVVGGLSILSILNTLFFHRIARVEESESGLEMYRPRETSHIKMNSKKIYRETIRNGGTLSENDERLQLEEKRSTASSASSATNLFIERESYCRVTCTATFILHVLWFSVLQLQFWFLSSMRYHLIPQKGKGLVFRDEIYNYGQICLIILAPLFGFGIDLRRKSTGKKYDDKEIVHLKSAVIPVVLTSVFSIVLVGICFIPDHSEVLYAIDILLLLIRYFSLATMGVYIFQMACLAEGRDLAGMELSRLASSEPHRSIYPQVFFGRLFSVTFLIGMLAGACHFPLLILMKEVMDAKLLYILIALVVLNVVSWAHPLHLVLRVRRLEEENERRIMSNIWSTDNATYMAIRQMRRGDTNTVTTSLSYMDINEKVTEL